jgi:hypothetical protein
LFFVKRNCELELEAVLTTRTWKHTSQFITCSLLRPSGLVFHATTYQSVKYPTVEEPQPGPSDSVTIFPQATTTEAHVLELQNPHVPIIF